MKGFGIHVKNDLIEKKHIQNMGVSVWLYMLLLDKVTKIDRDIGYVLGGKPVTEKEITEEMGISPATFYRWVAALRKHEYISTTRTPRGLIFRVYKAVKPSIKSDKSPPKRVVTSDKSDSTKVINPSITSDKSNKDYSVDSTVRPLPTVKGKPTEYGDAETNKVIKIFNECFGVDLKSRKYERFAASSLSKKYGVDKVCEAIRFTASIQGQSYAPSVASITELRDKLPKIVRFKAKQLKQERSSDELKQIFFK